MNRFGGKRSNLKGEHEDEGKRKKRGDIFGNEERGRPEGMGAKKGKVSNNTPAFWEKEQSLPKSEKKRARQTKKVERALRVGAQKRTKKRRGG